MDSFEETAKENEKIARRKARRIQRAREAINLIEFNLLNAEPKLKPFLDYEFDQLRRILKNDDKEDNRFNT
ncbi:hypothetical protein [Bacillus pumilus]|uniref:Uncharacterized protein n=2 Tax=Bacillus pumilus TaxID=1408 RepID=A0AAD0HN23_BACPU|nr:hypothetical protein [Bacillus pumilus]AVM24287.1 hypothetical protein C5695_10740 [Bacillus pumilus]TYS42801.1 hypothetical protein FZC68_10350 [Bacillus pumilus]